MANILIVEDENAIAELIAEILADKGYVPTYVNSASKAFKALNETQFSAILLDIWLEGSELDGIGVLKTIKTSFTDLPIIMISGHGNIETAVEAIRLGAYDFIEKPFKAEKLIISVQRAVKTFELITENNFLKDHGNITLDKLAGTSKQISNLRKSALNLAVNPNSRIVICGEVGTGKEFLAKYIHDNSARKSKKFFTMNPAQEVIFNNSTQNGNNFLNVFQNYNGGTVYIDELTNLDHKDQIKLLSILQKNLCDIRFICGTSTDPLKSIENSALNPDLYYRLSVSTLKIPAIRERREDIEILCTNFIRYYSNLLKIDEISITPQALTAMQMYDWPGNVRQLKNVSEWLMIMKEKDKTTIEVLDLPNEIYSNKVNTLDQWVTQCLSQPYKIAKKIFDQEYFNTQFSKFDNNVAKVARYAKVNRVALHKKIKQLKNS